MYLNLQSPDLQSLILCLADSPQDIGTTSKLSDFIEEQKLVEESQLEFTLKHPMVRLQDVPSSFQSRMHPMRAALRERLRQELGLNIFYVFSDGTWVRYDEILFHPYCKSLNPDLLPLHRGIYDKEIKLENFRWIPESANAVLNYGDIEYVVLRILKNSQIMIANKRLNLFVSWQQDTQNPSLNALAMPIDFVVFYKDSSKEKVPVSVKWQEDAKKSDQGYLKIEPHSLNRVLYKNLMVDLETQRLIFTPFGSFWNGFEALIEGFFESEEEQKKGSYLKISEHLQHLELSSHEGVQAILNYLREKEKEYPFFEIQWQHHRQELAEFDHCLYLSSDHHMRISFRCEHFEVFNMGNLPFTITQGFAQGFRFLFEDEKSVIHKRGLRRNYDLKLLKHLGLYAFFIYESCFYFQRGTNSSHMAFDSDEDFLEHLFLKMGQILNLSEGSILQENLKQICSKNIINALHSYFLFLKHEFDNSDLHIFHQGSEYILKNAKEKWFELIQKIVEILLIQTEGDLFRRARTFYFPWSYEEALSEEKWHLDLRAPNRMQEDLQNITCYSLYSPGLKENLSLKSLFGIYTEGWDVYLDGKPLEGVTEADFQWKFELNEKDSAFDFQQNSDKIDWFELHPKFFLHGQEVSTESAQDLSQGGWLEHNGKIYILKSEDIPQLKALQKFWLKMSKVSKSKSGNHKEKNYYSLPKSYALDLLALRSLGIKIEGGEEWQKVCAFYDRLTQTDRQPEVPGTLNGELKNYQKFGLRWIQDLYELRLGGILADDMGLGKTLQALCFLENLRIKDELGHCLILVPTSLVYNWVSEAEKFTPDLPVYSFQSREKTAFVKHLKASKHAILVVTYGLFTEHEDFFSQFQWNIHIYDEAQNLKNIQTKRATAVRKVDAKFKVCLTGTPLENHLGEFYSLMDTVVPGSLGEYEDYRKTYVSPYTIKKADMQYLRNKVKPLMLRRTKSQILKELPEKTVSVMKIPFSEEQLKIYRDVALSWNQKVKDSIQDVGEARSQMIMLTALLRLRQVCSDPAAVPGVNFSNEPPKIELLRESISNIIESGESAIVFTQFIPTLERIQRVFGKQNLPALLIDGRMSKQKREKVLKDFNESDKPQVLIMTLKTGGVGLNLTKASYVFHLEPWWNPAVEDQATDRVHRIGQEKHVQVYRYLMQESVEEKIEILKDRKSSHFRALFDQVENEGDLNKVSSHLSKEDFEYLLS